MQMGMIFFASVSGGIYFHEFDKFEGRHVPPYIVGNVFMFGGIAGSVEVLGPLLAYVQRPPPSRPARD